MVALVFFLLFIGLLAALVVGVVLLVVRQRRLARERQQGLAAWAAARELRFYPDGAGVSAGFRGVPFETGSSRRAVNAVEGIVDGRAFVAFDYSYVTTDHHGSNGTSSSTTHRYSVVATPLGVVAPDLAVTPQGSFGRFLSGIFGTDLVVGDAVFDQRFHVSTNSEQFAREVLTPDLTAFLAAYQDRAWRIGGNQLIMFRSGQHSPAEIDAVLAEMNAVLARVPSYVWNKLRGPA